MFKTALFLSVILISCSLWASDKPLPNWIDYTREKSDGMSPEHFSNRIAPPDTFRLSAEYESTKAVVIGWSSYKTMLREISGIIGRDTDVELWAVSGPASISGVPDDRYRSIDCGINTVWMRDYGPFGINEVTNEVAVVDSIYRHYSYRRYDDKIPTCVANRQGIESFAMNLILDGGNVMVDSKRNLFMTKRTYVWNDNKTKEEVDLLLKEYFNVHKIHVFDYAGYPSSPADGTGHIDMYIKLLNDSTVLITETQDEPYKTACEKALGYFKSIKTPAGGNYKIIRIPGWSSGRTWYTYTNSLIVNDIVMIPSYSGHADKEIVVKKAYEDGIPGIKVRFINSDSSITAGGSIHCVTQLIPGV